jgi:hypothetical protein
MSLLCVSDVRTFRALLKGDTLVSNKIKSREEEGRMKQDCEHTGQPIVTAIVICQEAVDSADVLLF